MFTHTKITKLIQDRFTLSVELFPPRNGRSPDIIFRKLEKLQTLGVDFVSITKGAAGSHRGGTIPIGFLMGDRFGIEPLVHFRCRDLTKYQVENELVDHMYFDIKNVLAVLGDQSHGPNVPQMDNELYNLYASQLVKQMDRMRRGHYLPLPGQCEPKKGEAFDFCIGVAVYPDAEDMEKELLIVKEKVKAGADFAITQMIFSAETYRGYVRMLRDSGLDIPVIPGIRPITRRKHLAAAKDVFGAKLTPQLEKMLKDTEADEEDLKDIWLEQTLDLCKEMKEAGAPGVHLFILNDVGIAEQVVLRLKEEL